MDPAQDFTETVDLQPLPALLRSLGDLALRSVALDADRSGDTSATAELESELVAILRGSIDLLGRIEQLATPAFEQDYDFPEAENTWIGARSNQPQAPRLDDICFAAVFELRGAERRLLRAGEDTERLVARESARRKLHRALYAALESSNDEAGREHPATSVLKRRFAVELESALAVRTLFAKFRRALRRAQDDSAEAVLMALRYAAGALATLITSTHRGAIRVPDSVLLSRQKQRLLDWSRAGRPVASGLQLLEDIWTCADLLRDINRRQEIRRHDELLIRELLHPSSQRQNDWPSRLERLTGLDDELDALIVRSDGARGPDWMLEALLRLSCLI